MKPQLFVVVATGQNVANLAPVLEWAKVGDYVLWLESAAARKGNWADGAKRVLLKFGLQPLPSVPIDEVNDPNQVAEACMPVAEQWHDKTRPVLVTNGGNKLTPLGMLRAWAGQQPCVLYGNDRPAELWAFTDGIDNPPIIRPYKRHELDLEDILLASGHQVHGKAERVWRAPQPPAEWQITQPYATDADYTRQLHREHADWAVAANARDRRSTLRRALQGRGSKTLAPMEALVPASARIRPAQRGYSRRRQGQSRGLEMHLSWHAEAGSRWMQGGAAVGRRPRRA